MLPPFLGREGRRGPRVGRTGVNEFQAGGAAETDRVGRIKGGGAGMLPAAGLPEGSRGHLGGKRQRGGGGSD